MASEVASPWPNLAAARSFLRGLVGYGTAPAETFSEISLDRLGKWLVKAGLGPLTYRRYKETWPELAERLQPDYYITAIDNRVHFTRLAQIASLFTAEAIPFVMLKGAALSQTVYADHLRPMSDLDLWLRVEDMPAAAGVMHSAGFRSTYKEDRPIALQMLSDGELRFASHDRRLVELHLSPFTGWWLKRTANVDTDALWQRIRPCPLPALDEEEGSDPKNERGGQLSHVLCAEDTILHLAVHLAVNHQFGMWGIRSIVDVTMVMQQAKIDWQSLVQRAYEWRLATVLWTVLDLQEQLIGGQDLGPVLRALQPRRWKARLLARFIDPPGLLAAQDLRRSQTRFILLLLLTDRASDAARLILRTLWPERLWLEARYGEHDASYGRHLWNVLRHRTV